MSVLSSSATDPSRPRSARGQTPSRAHGLALRVDALAVQRGGRVLMQDVTFGLAPGDALLIRGANGAGKSSLLRALAGLTPVAAGRITYATDGEDALEPAHAVALLSHAEGLRPDETPRGHVRFFARWFGAAAEAEAVEAALQLYDLMAAADTPARRLSAGQKRRAALARVAASARAVWLLDEPAVGLDSEARVQLDHVIAAHRAAGGVVVAAVHEPVSWPDTRVLRMSPTRARRGAGGGA